MENASNIFLLLTAITATIMYGKYKDTPLKYLPYYLWYATILEFGADYLGYLDISSIIWYNIGINIELLFYFYIYYNYLKNKKIKKFLLYGAVFYELYFLINWVILESWGDYQVFPFTLGGILMIVIVYLFLLEMFQSDKILNTHNYLIFWISLGLLFYNIIPLPLFVIRSIVSINNYYSIMFIQYIANIIMYVLFIYGFIWSSMKYKSL